MFSRKIKYPTRGHPRNRPSKYVSGRRGKVQVRRAESCFPLYRIFRTTLGFLMRIVSGRRVRPR